MNVLWRTALTTIALAQPFVATAQEQEPHRNSEPLHPLMMPALAPASFLAPGAAHFWRGDSETGFTLLKWYGVAAGTFFGSAVLYALSGAADSTTPILTPLILAGGSAWFSLALADYVGGFTNGAPRMPKKDTEIESSVVYLKKDVFGKNVYSRTQLTRRLGEFELRARYMADRKFEDNFYRLGAGYLIREFSQPYSGIWFDFDAQREVNAVEDFRIDLLEYKVRAQVPFALLAPSLDFIETRYSVGYQQYFLKFNAADGIDTNSGLTGGFETRAQVFESAALIAGYSHARDELEASVSTGFTGVYFVGGEVAASELFAFKLKSSFGHEFVHEAGVRASW